MSIKKKVSIRLAVQDALDKMGADGTRDVPVFTSWAVTADSKIGSFYAYKPDIMVINVSECRAELPCGVVAVLGILIGDHGCACDLKFNTLFSSFNSMLSHIDFDPTSGFVVMDGVGGGSPSCSDAKYYIQDNSLVFSNKINAEKITIKVLRYQMDDDGFPLVNENHIDAISQYILYNAALRTRWKPRADRMPEGAIKDMFYEWGRKCRDARADDADPSPSERAALVSMVNDPLSGIGIYQFRFNDRWFRGLW